MQRMIFIGTRVLVKISNLISNPCRSKFRWIWISAYKNVTNSVGENKYKTKFDDNTTKELYSSLLRIKDLSSGLLLLEAVNTLVELNNANNMKQISKVKNDNDIEEEENIIFLIDSTCNDNF